ncbi:MAG: helix-turn-helix domain-containing protein [Polaromonas sp.]
MSYESNNVTATAANCTVPIGHLRTHAGTPGAVVELTTDGIPARERLDFWHHAHLGRMALSGKPEGRRPFEGRVRRILGKDAHLVEHTSDALVAVRSDAQCAQDGVDYISINLMLSCTEGLVDHGGQQRLQAGSLWFVDSALPVEFRYPKHHSLSIFLPRRRVLEALDGAAPRMAGGALLPAGLQAGSGIGAVLESHMRMVAEHADAMSPAQRVTAISACAELALSVVQAAHQGAADPEQFQGGFYQAAMHVIDAGYGDPQLNPGAVAAAIGCSRASLYRLFASHDQGVAAMIWAARLEAARRMVASASHQHLLFSEIAFRCGFTDQSTFNRMFRRRYGISPRDARAAAEVRPTAPPAARC